MNEKEYFEGVAQYRLMAKKDLGQNFLISPKVASQIVDALDIQKDENVLEIGSGAGSLTFFLAQKEGVCTSIDVDEGLVVKTQNDFADAKNVKVVMGNAMRWDYAPYHKIIGNLPYYITSGILEHVLLEAKNATKCVFMVQKEAFQRLNSKPGNKEYGPLSILLSYRGVTKRLMTVGRDSFCPPPHIESVVFSIDIKENTSTEIAKKLYDLCSALFLLRRKTIKNNLLNYLKSEQKAADALKKAKIDERERPEQISPERYLALLDLLQK